MIEFGETCEVRIKNQILHNNESQIYKSTNI